MHTLDATNTNRAFFAKDEALSSAFSSPIADFRDMPMGSVQVVWQGAAGTTGAFTLHASNFPEISTFDDNAIPCSEIIIDKEAGSHLWVYERLAFRYMQLRYTPNGETTGVFSAIALGKKS
jgi:hypothetical protein